MLTIKEFLELDLVPWYKNLTDAPIPTSRPIEYVSVNDLPLDDFIRKNEMVISIATPYVKEEALMTEFIEGLIKAEASIFLLAIPSDTMSLSEKNRKLAEDGGLPILQIPWDLRFADICETVLHRVHKDYNEDVEKAKVLQADMLNCFLNGNNLETAAKIISENTACSVAITNTRGEMLAGASRALNKTQIPLEVNGHLYGYLCVDNMNTLRKANLLSHTLSPLLSLWFYKDELIETTQLMARDDLIWSLANGSDPDSENNQRTAKLMDLHLSRTYACLVGRVNLNNNVSEHYQKNWIDANVNTLREVFESTAKSFGRQIMFTHQKNAVITYLEILPSGGKNQITRFLDALEANLRLDQRNINLAWGVSEIKEGPTDYRNYYLHAKLAVDLCTNDTRFMKRFFYENTLIYNMMSTLSSNEDFLQNTYNILEHIVEYDKTKSTKLMDTLRVYLSCKNISETARKLSRHRQTLLYQLEKIEDLTGLSLKDNDELFLLEVCMRLQMDFSSVE